MNAEDILNNVAAARKQFDNANAARYDAQMAAEADPSLLPAFEAAKAAQDAAADALGLASDALTNEINARAAVL